MSANYDIFPSQSPSDNATFTTSENPFFPVQELFAMSQAGIILTAISGVLSTICSMITLNIIRLSNQRFTTTHHRIMACMSVFDIMASVCMALTTLPMPSDDILRFAGPMLGNKTTCQLQGLFILLGLTGGSALYVCLSWYFVCRITLKMDTHTIQKRLEPVFYVYTLVLSIAMATIILKHNMIHSFPRFSFCIIAPDLTPCVNNYTLEETFLVCDLDELHDYETVFLTCQIFVALNIAFVLIAMIVIIVTVQVKNVQIIRSAGVEQSDQYAANDVEETSTSEQQMKGQYEQQESRVLVIQALLYILTFITVWVFGIGPGMFTSDPGIMNTLLVFKSIFFPLQGFWNLIIFVYDKAYMLYQSDRYEGFWKTINIVMCRPYLIPEFDLPESLERPFEENEVPDSRFEPKETTTDFDSIPWAPPSEDLDPVNYSEGTSDSEEQRRDMTLEVDSIGLRRFSRINIMDAQINNNSAMDIESPNGSLGSSEGSSISGLPYNVKQLQDQFFLQYITEDGSDENERNGT